MKKRIRDWTLAEFQRHCKNWTNDHSCEDCLAYGWCGGPPDEWELRELPLITADEKAFLRVIYNVVPDAIIGRDAEGKLYWDTEDGRMAYENLLPYKAFPCIQRKQEYLIKDFFDEED